MDGGGDRDERESLLTPRASRLRHSARLAPLYDFAPAVHDQTWALLVLLVAMHVGLGLSVRGGG